MEQQITTLVIFKTSGIRNQFWAFQQVPLALFRLKGIPGLQFAKSMGSGGGKGFDFTPSLNTYCWLLVWDDRAHAESFFQTNSYFKKYTAKCSEVKLFYLKNVLSHGLWSKVNPFTKTTDFTPDATVVVLTRARIKLRRIVQFWTKVGRTANELYKFEDLQFAIGIGELPFIQQATISIWKNPEAVKQYAYKDETHKKVIALTRQYQWYSEELFARFVLVEEKTLSKSLN
jgi:hypothetical protein